MLQGAALGFRCVPCIGRLNGNGKETGAVILNTRLETLARALQILPGYDLDDLLQDLIEHTNYTRFAVYREDGFIHADYKFVGTDKRVIFNSDWERVKEFFK